MASKETRLMADVMLHVTTIAVIAVLIVLLLGLWTMMKGKSANMSQKLMRWRVGLQFVAILVIMVTLYFRQ
jgi:hypothetical protein